MRFSIVESGYDKRQVDSCLDELGIRLSRLAARAAGAAGAGGEWDEIRQEAAWLSGLLRRLDLGDTAVTRDAGAAGRRTEDLVPADTPTAAAGVPGSWVGVGGLDAAVESPSVRR